MDIQPASRKCLVNSFGCETLLQQIHRFDSLPEIRNGVDVKIDAEPMPELIRHQLGVDSCLTKQTRVRAPHHLKSEFHTVLVSAVLIEITEKV